MTEPLLSLRRIEKGAPKADLVVGRERNVKETRTISFRFGQNPHGDADAGRLIAAVQEVPLPTTNNRKLAVVGYQAKTQRCGSQGICWG